MTKTMPELVTKAMREIEVRQALRGAACGKCGAKDGQLFLTGAGWRCICDRCQHATAARGTARGALEEWRAVQQAGN